MSKTGGGQRLAYWRSWLRMNWRYLRGDTPWDSGRTPPELEAFLQMHPPGRALDIGCGTGTNTLRLARAGWQAVGVDFAWLALRRARRKARRGGLTGVQFLLDDAARLDKVQGPFDLALDIGCFHALGADKAAYLRRLDDLLRPGGHWLVYGFWDEAETARIGLRPADLAALPADWRILWRQRGRDRADGRASIWLLAQKGRAHQTFA